MPETARLEVNPAPALKLFTGRYTGEPIGSIGIATRDHMNAATVTALMFSDMSWLGQGQVIDHQIVQGSILTQQRNLLAQRMRGDWLLFIDDDMVWQPDAIRRLIQSRDRHDVDILGGLCFRRSEPYQPTLYMREGPTDGAYNFLERWDEGEIVEVDATGMAFCLIHKRVFEMIAGSPMPPYEWRVEAGPPNFFRWEGKLGEDLRFCQDARAAGARIFVDTSIEIGHISEVTIGHESFLASVAQRSDETYRARLEVNTQMGLPTLSREDARRKLGWA